MAPAKILLRLTCGRAGQENFPYFHVEFGCNGGYAHVIENADKFDEFLGKGVAAGLLEVDANVYRKPKTQPFEEDKKCAAASAARRPARAAARGSADAGLGCAGA